jgi:D-glycero-D-manno-heptose 1,7-bisphosphate phosphatase
VKKRALFLDRDGVINVDRGYVCAREHFEFVQGIFELCRHAAALDYVVIVVTNQAGIGRGYYGEEEFLRLTQWMCEVFRDCGGPIARVYHCPYHPEHGIGIYRADSSLRKPHPGMILQAAADFDLDLEGSVLIGDKETDVLAGRAAGVGCNLLFVPESDSRIPETATCATSTVGRLADAMPFLGSRLAEEII